MKGCRKTCGAVYMKSAEQQREDEDDRQSLDRCDQAGSVPRAMRHALCCRSIRYSVSSTTDMSFGTISATIRAAVEDHQPVGDLVHVREVVLDVDAGAAPTP